MKKISLGAVLKFLYYIRIPTYKLTHLFSFPHVTTFSLERNKIKEKGSLSILWTPFLIYGLPFCFSIPLAPSLLPDFLDEECCQKWWWIDCCHLLLWGQHRCCCHWRWTVCHMCWMSVVLKLEGTCCSGLKWCWKLTVWGLQELCAVGLGISKEN